ncbi:MAG: uracil phosphoribosyltransferase, partial [Acholeplasmatales bacterium]
MGKLIHLRHPLLEHKLTHIREKTTDTKTFRENVSEISALMAYEITRDLTTRPQAIETPLKPMTGHVLDKTVVLVPILRAGLGMVEGIHRLIPTAKVGHIGLYRDETTLQPHSYYVKFPPDVAAATVLLLDPMLATGG